jgi:hypothetical protein
MASLERTAYPTLPKAYSKAELQRDFSFSDDEIKWIRSKSVSVRRTHLARLRPAPTDAAAVGRSHSPAASAAV